MDSPFDQIKIKKINKGKLLAVGTMLIAGTVEVEFRIMQGPKGPFVGLPSERYDKPDGSVGYKNLVKVPDDTTYKLMQQQVVAVYSEGETEDQGSSPEAANDSIPF